MDTKKLYDAIFGIAVGDAVGVPAEFHEREYFIEHPVTEMMEYGSHNQPIGTWSDDTSMTLCMADALATNIDEPDYDLIMSNFLAWSERGAFSAGGECFDIGGCCSDAIYHYTKGTLPIECGPSGDWDCGNGALMRIMPALFWLENKFGRDFILKKEARDIIANLTTLTHGHARCIVANIIYLAIADELLNGVEKVDAVQRGIFKTLASCGTTPTLNGELHRFGRLTNIKFGETPADEISGSGYVVDTLEAAVWAFLSTDNYRNCILAAVNLGEDTDTVAAIAGGLAGLYYGKEGIPKDWYCALRMQNLIGGVCANLGQSFGL